MLSCRNINKRFGGVQALDSVSFEVAKGEIFGLIGPNGAGKTTTFNMISGMLKPDSGLIMFEKTEIQGTPPHRRAGLRIARTFQHVQLIPDATVLENVTIGAHLRGRCGVPAAILRFGYQRAEEAELFRIAAQALELIGISELAQLKVNELAYGLQRRVELARAVAMNPKLLLLDEPAAGLNDAETDALGILVKAIRDTGVTVLLVEHAMALVLGICDRIAVLDFGRHIAVGTPAEIRANPAVIEAYLGTPDEETAHA